MGRSADRPVGGRGPNPDGWWIAVQSSLFRTALLASNPCCDIGARRWDTTAPGAGAEHKKPQAAMAEHLQCSLSVEPCRKV